ncbi:ARM repeat-containing protein [Atractiella rhizophila]|nr:ARM repeat-containing protein [Atractiella rhizophila]
MGFAVYGSKGADTRILVYQLRHFDRDEGLVQKDAFTGEGAEEDGSSYAARMRRQNLEREEKRVKDKIEELMREGKESAMALEAPDATPKRSRWDQSSDTAMMDVTNRNETSAWDDQGEQKPKKKRSRWDETPALSGESSVEATPKRSRWDQTPVAPISGASLTPQPLMFGGGIIMPDGSLAIPTDLDKRNRYLSDEELNQMLPAEGYEIVEPPPGYAAIRTPSRKLQSAPAIEGQGFLMPDDSATGMLSGVGQLAFFKPEDATYFSKILGDQDDSGLTVEEMKERKIVRLKTALRQITDKAREFGAGPLFDKILPLLMERSLEDQERHLLVKVIDRVLYKLDDLVRPYVHKILVVMEPLLIDEDYYARVEGREIISNLSKAAGLAHMISTMRPDIDHVDEYVRNTTARAFSVVASALVCKSKKSWQARHTGINIVQQIAIMMSCAVLPHLKNLVEAVANGLEDEQEKVRTMTALCLAALAEAAVPHGIESFDSVLKPLWVGIRKHPGKGHFIIPLMDAEFSHYYTKEVMEILIQDFQTRDEEMKKIVLKVVQQCASTDGVQPSYVKEKILPEFFRRFFIRRMALDRRNYRQVVETTVELAQKAGVAEIVGRVVDLKDESEPFRKMVTETIQKVITSLGASDIDERLEVQLVDGILHAFQEQTVEDQVMLDGFGTVVNALGLRIKPYLTQIVSTILWRLNNKSAKVRQQAADLVSKLAVVIKQCGEDGPLAKLGVVLFEQLGEDIIAAEAAIANVVGMTQMSPPVKDLLPRMAPILRNRHEKVQEAYINLIERIADRDAEFVSARDWMRICFELLDLLKAHKKAIRRAAVNSLGYIAKAIGPQDVLSVLLTNLRAMSFLFEYIGEMGKDYIHSVVTCLEDALTDRDLVHRQTAAAIVKHLALGTAGLGTEDALMHLMNLTWPNVFETSPHVVGNVFDAIEGMRVALGPGIVLSYVLQGLFHPARRVRETYWRIYNSLYLGSQDALSSIDTRKGELTLAVHQD